MIGMLRLQIQPLANRASSFFPPTKFEVRRQMEGGLSVQLEIRRKKREMCSIPPNAPIAGGAARPIPSFQNLVDHRERTAIAKLWDTQTPRN